MDAGIDAMKTVAQTARVWGITPCRVRQLLAEGRIYHVRTPLGRLIPAYEVERVRREREPVALDKEAVNAG